MADGDEYFVVLVDGWFNVSKDDVESFEEAERHVAEQLGADPNTNDIRTVGERKTCS